MNFHTSLLSIIQYSSTVHKVCPKILPQIQLNIYFVTSRLDWLGIYSQAQKCLKINHKPFHEVDMKLKKFLNRIFYWLTDWLTCLLIPSEKHNSIMAIATALIFSLFNVASSCDVPFLPTAAAPVLASRFYRNLYLLSFELHFFLHCRVGNNLWYTHYGFSARLG